MKNDATWKVSVVRLSEDEPYVYLTPFVEDPKTGEKMTVGITIQIGLN